jgi:2'-5' RNA ligase
MNDGVMVAYLPTDTEWCKQESPHMTLVYAGTTSDFPFENLNALGKDAITSARITGSMVLDVVGTDTFGDDERVDVLLFHPTPKLWAARNVVEKWNDSTHPFVPHATIGPQGSAFSSVLPSRLYFNKIVVSYGSRMMSFDLDRM